MDTPQPFNGQEGHFYVSVDGYLDSPLPPYKQLKDNYEVFFPPGFPQESWEDISCWSHDLKQLKMGNSLLYAQSIAPGDW